MRYSSFVSVFLLVLLLISPNLVLAEEKEKVIVVSEEVGKVIDAVERERFGLWPEVKGFKSAVFLQLSDGSYVAEVIYEKNGEEKKVRTPHSEMSIKSLKTYIAKVLKGEIQPASLPNEEKTEKAKSKKYSRGELIIVSGKVGASIDKNESKEFGLFRDIPNFERAILYSKKGGGYLIEIQTTADTLFSVVQDTKMVSILGDYIDGYEKVRTNRESFEKKWSIVSYDEQGIPITENEMSRYHKTSNCCALGCGLGGSALVLVPAWLIAATASLGDPTEEEKKKINICFFTVIAAGAISGYFIGNIFDNRIAKDSFVREIKNSRKPK